MTPSISRGTIAQVLTAAIWLSDLSGHSAVGAVLKDPNLAVDLTTFLALAGTLWGVAEHVYAAYTAKQAAPASFKTPETLTKSNL